MTRVTPLPPDRLTPAQKRIHDEIAAARSGHVRGPFAIWLRVPELAEAANKLGNVVRRKTRLEPRLFELMVLVVARHWSAQYEWRVHEEHARAAGLGGAIIEAIRMRRRPEFEKDDERLIYDTIVELNDSRGLSQPSYDRAVQALGQEVLIELIAAAGFYTMVAMTLDAFDVPAAGAGRPLP
ncbi:MAG: carboxymuconolactone decarboxylase family protein [Stellaceae bacterium]